MITNFGKMSDKHLKRIEEERSNSKPGFKDDFKKPDLDLVLGDFTRALQLVGEVGTKGANKYSDHGWLEVREGKRRYSSAMLRHYFKEEEGEWEDEELELPHAACVAWNALARLELILREQ